jgi:hypothetical protein
MPKLGQRAILCGFVGLGNPLFCNLGPTADVVGFPRLGCQSNTNIGPSWFLHADKGRLSERPAQWRTEGGARGPWPPPLADGMLFLTA